MLQLTNDKYLILIIISCLIWVGCNFDNKKISDTDIEEFNSCDTLVYGCYGYPVPPGDWKDIKPPDISIQTCDSCKTGEEIRKFESEIGSVEISLTTEEYLRILYYASNDLIGLRNDKGDEKDDLFFYREYPNTPFKAIVAYDLNFNEKNHSSYVYNVLIKIFLKQNELERKLIEDSIQINYIQDSIGLDSLKAYYAYLFDTLMERKYERFPDGGWKIDHYMMQSSFLDEDYPLAGMCKIFSWSNGGNWNLKESMIFGCMPDRDIYENYSCMWSENRDEFPENELGLCFTHNDLAFFIFRKYHSRN